MYIQIAKAGLLIKPPLRKTSPMSCPMIMSSPLDHSQRQRVLAVFAVPRRNAQGSLPWRGNVSRHAVLERLVPRRLSGCYTGPSSTHAARKLLCAFRAISPPSFWHRRVPCRVSRHLFLLPASLLAGELPLQGWWRNRNPDSRHIRRADVRHITRRLRPHVEHSLSSCNFR